jgi:hypothetical protein
MASKRKLSKSQVCVENGLVLFLGKAAHADPSADDYS